VDVLVDRFAMCHRLDLRDRLALDTRTLPLADLLLSKLQVVERNEKDLKDLVALLADHDLDGEDAVDTARILAVADASPPRGARSLVRAPRGGPPLTAYSGGSSRYTRSRSTPWERRTAWAT
jgi:hypothetical protein